MHDLQQPLALGATIDGPGDGPRTFTTGEATKLGGVRHGRRYSTGRGLRSGRLLPGLSATFAEGGCSPPAATMAEGGAPCTRPRKAELRARARGQRRRRPTPGRPFARAACGARRASRRRRLHRGRRRRDRATPAARRRTLAPTGRHRAATGQPARLRAPSKFSHAPRDPSKGSCPRESSTRPIGASILGRRRAKAAGRRVRIRADRTSPTTPPRPKAERALFRSLRKPQDGWTSRHLNRYISAVDLALAGENTAAPEPSFGGDSGHRRVGRAVGRARQRTARSRAARCYFRLKACSTAATAR